MEYNEDKFNESIKVAENIIKCLSEEFTIDEGMFTLIIAMYGIIRQYPEDTWLAMIDQVHESLKYKFDFQENQ